MNLHESSSQPKPGYEEQVAALDALHIQQAEVLESAGVFAVIDAIGSQQAGIDFPTYPKSVVVYRDTSTEAEGADKPLVQHTGLLVKYMRPPGPGDYTSKGKLMAPEFEILRIQVSDFNLDEGQKLVDTFRSTEHPESNLGAFALQLGRTRTASTSFSKHQISLVRELARQLEQQGTVLNFNHDLTEIVRPVTGE